MFERILIVESDASERERLDLLLADKGYSPICARNAQEAQKLLAAAPTDAVLCDLDMPGIDGFDLVPQLARIDPHAAIVLLCSDSERDVSEVALQRGAWDGLDKPVRTAPLLLALRRIEERKRAGHAHTLLERDLGRVVGDRPIVAASQPMIDLLERIEATAGFKSAALLHGEVGTGRECLARAIHAQSPRRAGPFVVVDCATHDPQSLEAALFGSLRPSTQSARRGTRGLILDADHGTLYLDSVHALAPGVQARLLQTLEEEAVCPMGSSKSRPIDVRFLASGDDQLEAAVSEGRFDARLHARLSASTLPVPPLRERRDDIPLLVDHYLAFHVGTRSGARLAIEDDALDRLTHYAWPGNVRELEMVIRHATIRAETDRIGLGDLPAEVSSAMGDTQREGGSDLSLKRARRAFEAQIIRRALHATGGNRTHAAKLLEISHRALLYKLKEYGLRD